MKKNLIAALDQYGPLSILVDASKWQHYTGGIFTAAACSSTQTGNNQAAVLVGYGNANGQNYWIVRNSWGPQWGESGYIRLAYGSNTCGVSNFASFVTV